MTKDEQQQIEVDGFGVRVVARGKELLAAVLGVGLVAVLFYAGYIHHTETSADNHRIIDQLNELVYVLALPQPDREKLLITMPDSLRLKIRQTRRVQQQQRDDSQQ